MSGLGFVSLRGRGPRGATSLSGMGSETLVAIGGSLVRGFVLAGSLQASTVNSSFDKGPFEGVNLVVDGRSIAASTKAMVQLSQLGLLVDWYPDPDAGWHVGASGGLGVSSLINQADDSTWAGTSLAGTLFGGYDWAIGRHWSMGLDLIVSGATASVMKDATDAVDTGYKLKSFSVGLGGSILYF